MIDIMMKITRRAELGRTEGGTVDFLFLFDLRCFDFVISELGPGPGLDCLKLTIIEPLWNAKANLMTRSDRSFRRKLFSFSSSEQASDTKFYFQN